MFTPSTGGEVFSANLPLTGGFYILRIFFVPLGLRGFTEYRRNLPVSMRSNGQNSLRVLFREIND